jgi:hypothetical protein
VIALWLVGLFTANDRAESLQGDLLEEFSDLAAKSGIPSARRWYWRQSLKTAVVLFGSAFRLAPSSIVCAVVFGFLVSWFGSGLPEKFIVAVLHKFPIYPNHWNAYVFWITDGILIAAVLESLAISCVVALIAKGRELVATITLGAVLLAFKAGFYICAVIVLGSDSLVWPIIVNQIIQVIAILVGGIIVRELRAPPLHTVFGS